MGGLICLGARVEGSHRLRQEALPPPIRRQDPATTTFTTSWGIPDPFKVGSVVEIPFNVTAPGGGNYLPKGTPILLMLWTSAAVGSVPNSANTYGVIKVECKHFRQCERHVIDVIRRFGRLVRR